jgi:hypothetical protein
MGRLFRTAAAVIAVSSVALVFTAASPAGAATTNIRVAHHGAIRLRPGNSTNANFAGYQTTQTSVTSAADKFKVPTLTGCANSDAVGFGVDLNNTAGTSFDGGNIFAICNGTAPQTPLYLADLTINNNEGQLPITIKAGDKVSISVTVGATITTVTVKDSTQGSAVVETDKGVSMQVADIGAIKLSNGTSALGIPTFGTVKHTSTVNAKALSTLKTTAFNRVNGTTTQITTGPLTTTFATTFAHE